MNEKYTTETLDKIYLEYANLTSALTRKEIILAGYIKKLEKENAKLKVVIKDAVSIYENGAVIHMSETEEWHIKEVFGKMQDILEGEK